MKTKKQLLLTTIILIAIILIQQTNTTANTDKNTNIPWSQYKGTPDKTGYIQNKWKNTGYRYTDYKIAWTYQTNLCIASSPILADLDNDGEIEISFASCDGNQYALKAKNGALLWKTTTGGGLIDPTAYDIDQDGTPEIIVGGAQGKLYCLNGANGQPKWIMQGGFQKTTPIIQDINKDGKPEIIANSLEGTLYIISPHGKTLKKLEIGKTALSPPVINNEDPTNPQIIITDAYNLYIINTNNWTTTTIHIPETIIPTTPVLHDTNNDNHKETIIVGEHHLYAISLKNKKTLWNTSYQGGGIKSPTIGPALNNNNTQILYGTDQGLYIYDTNGTLIKTLHDIRMGTSSPIIIDIDNDGHNEIILGSYDGEIIITDLTNTSTVTDGIKWYYQTQAPIMSSPAIGDGDQDQMPEIYLGSRDYNLYCIDGIPQNTTTKTTPTQTNATTTTQPSTKPNTKIITETTLILTTILIITIIKTTKKTRYS